MGPRAGGRRFGAAGLALALALVGGCGKELDVSKPEQAIKREVERDYRVAVDDVSCPEDVTAERGATFQCVVGLRAGDRLTANVTQTDAEGALEFELAEQILTPRSVAQAIRRQYKATRVNCGKARYWVSRPGTTFTCRARDEAGGDARIEVTVRDTRGNIDLDFAP
jgi:hypothetical protein